MKKLLEIKNLNKSFHRGGMFNRKKITAVDDVSFSIDGKKPVMLSIVGESGSGKTTVARLLLKLLNPDSGTITINGSSYYHSKNKLDKKDIIKIVQPVFQNPFESFSMYNTVDHYLVNTAKYLNGAKNKNTAVEMTEHALESLGLHYDRVAGKYPNQFSGGELQRISIARALIPNPKIIVADEPVSMIDASLKMNVVNLFKKIKNDFNISFIYITHDLATAYYISDYIAIMYLGEIVEYGNAKTILDNPSHPYTKLLLESIPSVTGKWKIKEPCTNLIIPSENIGCKFYPRCKEAKEECMYKKCIPKKLKDNRIVLCHHT